MDLHRIKDDLFLAVGRVLRSDFGRDAATETERATLAEGPCPVGDPLAQDYAVWRRSVLLLGAATLVLAFLIQIIRFQTLTDILVEVTVATARELSVHLSEDEARANIEEAFGVDNLALLNSIEWLSLFATLAVTILAVLAARAWPDLRRSARLARRAWYVLLGAPLTLAILPWSRLLDVSHLESQEAQDFSLTVGMTLGFFFFFELAPKLLSVFPGIIRASVSLKTLLHESPAPGYMVVLFAPVYAMFVLVVFTIVNQIEGNLLLLAGIGCLVIAPLIYLWRGRDFLRSHTAEESATLVRGVRRQVYLFNAIGTVVVVLFLLDMEDVTALDVLQLLTTVGGGLLLMTVVAADLVLGLLRLEHAQAREFVGSELATSFERKLDALHEAGLGEIRRS